MRSTDANKLARIACVAAAAAVPGCVAVQPTATTETTATPTTVATVPPPGAIPPESRAPTRARVTVARGPAPAATDEVGQALVEARELGQQGEVAAPFDAGEDRGDGWAMVQVVNSTERTDAAAGDAPGSNLRGGGNLASRLYGELLGTELPAQGEFLGQHTTNIRQITFTAEGSDFDPVVSRDGSRLIYASTQHRPTADIYVKQTSSRVLTRLTDDPAHDVMPSISPDGNRIAFASNRSGNWDIWVMPVTGGRAIQIAADPSHELHPSWSPDGRHLVFCRLGQTSGRWELWVADVFDNASTQFIGYGLFPEWCPMGGTGVNGSDKILFQRSRERGARTFAVWTIDFDRATLQAGNETQIAASPEGAYINPSWSPDGMRIAFAAVNNPDAWTGEGADAGPTNASIWMVGLDGHSELPLTNGAGVDIMPAWSPTGQVFFVSDRGGSEALWALDIAPALLTASGGNPLRQTDYARVNPVVPPAGSSRGYAGAPDLTSGTTPATQPGGQPGNQFGNPLGAQAARQAGGQVPGQGSPLPGARTFRPQSPVAGTQQPLGPVAPLEINTTGDGSGTYVSVPTDQP